MKQNCVLKFYIETLIFILITFFNSKIPIYKKNIIYELKNDGSGLQIVIFRQKTLQKT